MANEGTEDLYDDTLRRMEAENRKRILDALTAVPKRTPIGWKRADIAVGGLEYIGLSERQPKKMICISSQNCSIIDCDSRAITYPDISYDELELTAVTDALPDERIRLAGIGGGGLGYMSAEGDILTMAAPEYPKVQIIFQPKFKSCFLEPEECSIIFEEYEMRAFGFSKCGNYIVAACSGGVAIFSRQQEPGG